MQLKPTALLAALLLCATVTATPTTLPGSADFDCPLDCLCTLSQHTHQQLLHAKCNSTKGLMDTELPLHPAVPLHSIDLSYLGLTRVAHLLEHLPNVTSLDLSHNELHEIGHLSKRIKKLNLKHNRLTSAKLAKLPQHVQFLNLQHNDITTLPLDLTHLHHLQQLELSHNSINCSCETLEVRNWLQERHVYMEHAVVCSYPIEARGKPWLQLKQSDVCEKEQRGWYAANVDENELMMGDQPEPGSGELRDEEEQELGKTYLPLSEQKSANPLDDAEGSGDLSEPNMEMSRAASTIVPAPAELRARAEEQDEEEGSGEGSGGGLLVIHGGELMPDDFDAPDSDKHNDDSEHDNKPVEEPAAPAAPIFKHMGIFEGETPEPQAVSEEPIVPVVLTKLETGDNSDVITDAPIGADAEESDDIMSAKMANKNDSNATYYLLGVIALIVVGLILFVAMKRCKRNSSAARDAEAQRQTELLDMDKKNLGKPLQRNGNEHSPLIAEKAKLDEALPKKDYDSKDTKDAAGQQPLLTGNGTANGGNKDVPTINEPAGDAGSHEYYPITPRYPTPQSPRASKYAQQPQGGEPNNNEPDASYLPSSPKGGRYSPVYSPETGRVKIKLTETPKPKTPMLVTRSKSNAGDIITTPVQLPEVHLPAPALAVGGNTNGHVSH